MAKAIKKTKSAKTNIDSCPKCKENLAHGIYSKLITVIHGASFDLKKIEPVIGVDVGNDPDELLSLCFHCGNCGERLGHIGEEGQDE